MPPVEAPEALYALLMEERPQLHSNYSALADWSLSPAVLRWIADHIRPGFRTLETGCGYSTIVFALWGCRHDVISPWSEEHLRIGDWCRTHGASSETVTYRAGPSQRVLPAMKPTPLDLVIIDGSHAVAVPLIDYYYTADRLVKGGLLLVDDVQLRSVRQLCEFLDTEDQRWDFLEQVDRTRIYRKCVEGAVAEGVEWTHQPFCSEPPSPPQRGLLYRGWRRMNRSLRRLSLLIAGGVS